jgi:hypothetical protein
VFHCHPETATLPIAINPTSLNSWYFETFLMINLCLYAILFDYNKTSTVLVSLVCRDLQSVLPTCSCNQAKSVFLDSTSDKRAPPGLPSKNVVCNLAGRVRRTPYQPYKVLIKLKI